MLNVKADPLILSMLRQQALSVKQSDRQMMEIDEILSPTLGAIIAGSVNLI
jgi:hypothetical protein